MNTTVITSENIRTRGHVPVIGEARRGEDLHREDRQGAGSRKDLPSFLVAFDGDDVRISSGTRAQGTQERLPANVSSAGSSQALEGQRNGHDYSMTVKRTGAAVESGVVRYSASIGPYDVHVSNVAMKRYSEASSHRNWHPSTFELTV